MTYMCEISLGQKLYLDNQGSSTVVTIMSGGPGQQQQASNSFQTGSWSAPPELFATPQGAVIKINTEPGEHYIQVQGSSMSTMGGAPGVTASQQMQMQQVASSPVSSMPPMTPLAPMQTMMTPMQPMQPMQPMKMGNLEMNANPMEMRMGNMEMRMGGTSQPSQPTSAAQFVQPVTQSAPAPAARKFCSQCGAAIEVNDRFCSSCGHRLV